MPTRPNIENVKIGLMRKNEPFIDGYPIPFAQVFTDDLISNQETFDVFGFEQQITYTVIDGANLRIEGVNDTSMQVMYDLATGQDPYPAATAGLPPTRTYYPQETLRLNVLRNLLNDGSSGYEMVQFWDGWAAIIRNPAGGPRDRGNIVMDGRCKTPIVVYAKQGDKIAGTFDVVTLDSSGAGSLSLVTGYNGTAAITGTLVSIPAAANFRNFVSCALAVEIQARNATGTDGTTVNRSVRVPVTETMVGTGGLVQITANDLSPFGMTLHDNAPATDNTVMATHAFVTYIVKPPAGTADGQQGGKCLLNDPIPSTARYEI